MTPLPIIAEELRLEAVTTASGQLAWYRACAEEVLEWARAHKITDQASLAAAVVKLGEISVTGRDAEAKRKSWVEAPNRWVRAVNDGVKWVIGPLSQAEDLLKGSIAAWQQAERRRAEEEQRRREDEQRRQREAAEQAARVAADAARVAAAAAAAVAEAPTLPEFYERSTEAERAQADATAAATAAHQAQDAIQPVQPVQPIGATVRTSSGAAATVRMRWTFEVTDLTAVPRAFLTLDATKVREAIRASVKATEKAPSIPGIRVYQEPDVAVSA